MFSLAECIIWLAVGLTESVAIVTLNIITIIVFIKHRSLRKRSTYLIINLAVVDMLAGGTAVYFLFCVVGTYCNLWNSSKHWVYCLISYFFLFGSLTNITSIALERLHATMWPFRHRLIKETVYGLNGLIIAVVWVAAGLLSMVTTVLLEVKGPSHHFVFSNSVCLICLLIICVSYTSIVIKVRCGAQPQHHGAASRERKLTMTLLIVTVVSLLLYLPDNFYHIILSYATDIISSMSKGTSTRLHNFLMVFLYSNSLVNPILDAIRMPGYRSAVLVLFRRGRLQRQAAVFPLRDM